MSPNDTTSHVAPERAIGTMAMPTAKRHPTASSGTGEGPRCQVRTSGPIPGMPLATLEGPEAPRGRRQGASGVPPPSFGSRETPAGCFSIPSPTVSTGRPARSRAAGKLPSGHPTRAFAAHTAISLLRRPGSRRISLTTPGITTRRCDSATECRLRPTRSTGCSPSCMAFTGLYTQQFFHSQRKATSQRGEGPYVPRPWDLGGHL